MYFKPVYEEAEQVLKTTEERVKKLNDEGTKDYNAVLPKAKTLK